jgi:hypothetical protein
VSGIEACKSPLEQGISTAVGRNLAAEDRVEDTVQKSDRRGRVVPFGTMTGVGLVALIAIARLRLPH